MDIDLTTDPLGVGTEGPVYLKDIWPTSQEVEEAVLASVKTGMFSKKYANVFEGSDMWKNIQVAESDLYPWAENSTYIQHPPFFQSLTLDVPHRQ